MVLTEIAQAWSSTAADTRCRSGKSISRRVLWASGRDLNQPSDREKVRRRVRISTEDLGVKGMADYIDRICAWAAGYGITISEPLPPELRGPSGAGRKPWSAARSTWKPVR